MFGAHIFRILSFFWGGKLSFRVLCSQAAGHSKNSVLGKLAAKGLTHKENEQHSTEHTPHMNIQQDR